MGTYFKLTKQKIGFYKVIKRIGENRIDPPQHMDIDPTFNMIDLYPCHEQSEGELEVEFFQGGGNDAKGYEK